MVLLTAVFFVIPLVILLVIYSVITRQLLSDRMDIGARNDNIQEAMTVQVSHSQQSHLKKNLELTSLM